MREAENGIDDDLKKQEILRIDLFLLIEQQIQYIVAFLKIVLIGVAEDEDDDVQELELGGFGDVGIWHLQNLTQ